MRSKTLKAGTTALLILLAASCSFAGGDDVARKSPTTQNVPSHLQAISVTIQTGSAQGSGVLCIRDGIAYVLTCGHVIEDLRTEREVIDAKGSGKTLVEFKDAQIVRELIEDGRTVGRSVVDAEVLRYSDADDGEDLALLRVRKKHFSDAGLTFHLDKEIPAIGADLWHCGSLLGQFGSNSITSGVISQHGRVYRGKVYDQVTTTIFPGSSGGGVYTKDGTYIGMAVRAAGETFGLIVPARRIREWAKRVGCEFVLDPSVKVPEAAKFAKQPVEQQ
jgi:S1-C subfamily serine protease